MEMTRRGWLLAGLFLLAGIVCTGTVLAAPVIVFSDNFNDNILDTGKWTLDVVGTNDFFWERSNRAEFQTNGAGAAYWHSYLNSKPIIIDGWESIEITGKWTNTGYTSRTHIATVTDLDTPANTVSIEYSAWGSQMAYYWKEGSAFANVPVPSPNLVPYRLKVTKTGFEYYENGVLIKSATTGSMAGSRRFQLQIGAWEYSSILSQTYIDEIVVQYTETVPPVTSATVSGSPGPGGWYTAPVSVTLSAYDPSPGSGLDYTQYSLDGTVWNTYTAPVTVSNEGTTTFRYRSVDKAGNTETAKSLPLKIDSTAPVTTATLAGTPGGNGWYTSDVSVALTATDSSGGSGVQSTQYSLDGTAWSAYTTPFAVTGDGIKTVYYRSTDTAGNIETAGEETVLSDTFPGPNGPAAGWTPATGTWVIENGEYSASAASGGFGEAETGDPGWQNYHAEVKVFPILPASGWRAGISARTSPLWNSNSYYIHSLDTGLRMSRTVNGGVSDFRWDTFAIPANQWHTLGVEVEGNRIRYFYNGQLRADVTDSSLSSGKVALTAFAGSAYHVHFDNFKVTRPVYKSSVIKIDKTPPASTAALTGLAGLDGWNLSEVQVTLAATDNPGGSGVSGTEYSLGGGAWADFSAPFAVSAQGSTTLSYRSKDLAGNAEQEKTRTIRIDTAAPDTTAAYDGVAGTNGWYISPVTITLSANDPGSGVALVEYSVDNAGFVPSTVPFTITKEGTSVVSYRASDRAGNTGDAETATIRIDTKSPATTGTVTSGTTGWDGWYISPVTVALSATDPAGGSGLSGTEYQLDNDAWQPSAGTVTVSEEGATTLSYRAKDLAGNTETSQSLTIRIDTAAPETTATYSGTMGTNGWYTTIVTVTLTADDGPDGSGVQETSYHAGSGPATKYTTPFVLANEGPTAIGYQSKDNAGNTEAGQSATVKVETQPPVISVTSPAERDYLQSETLAIGFTATDTTSGLGTVTATIDGTTVSDGQAVDLTGLPLGTHIFTVTAADSAGNTKTVSRTFTIKPVPATANIDPDTLNMKSQSDKNAVTVYIELAGSDVNAIDVGSVTLTYAGKSITALATPTSVGDENRNGIPDRMVKFNRQDLIGIVVPGESIAITVNGKVAGDAFEDTGTIRVIGQEPKNDGGNKK